MKSGYRLLGLDPAPYRFLFDADEATLARHHARRVRVDEHPGYPCRVSLTDAPLGAEMLLVHHCHHPVEGPYRASGPVFLPCRQQTPAHHENQVPEMLKRRLLSLRFYDANNNLVKADVIDGKELDVALIYHLSDSAIQYGHIHFARQGCFACRIEFIL